ncbi:dTDP-4-dehydrorhamnose reductase [Flavobacterium sp. GT3R68]|uniref:dTDP-4-dehydrorhamnose reductase n=1 Tax=Flavobacterium sp. GT3R68 TaxID=2594437 RepID=UPI000F86A860|nr:dTDP-4-dehydrorhamnose reductase [Flavobacterium sp. GT3R68]RTY95909.1 dTDP-4-dehydrorhamnose reductase [Flavobacterium sp. GSN2]TRW93681.1 dTDP-4-dehydrorhamnose reductase [Flavobacterium sp. GT3R68]
MVVLVTGANGQLGTALQSIEVKYPEINFVFVSSFECDVTNKHSIQNIFEKEKPSFCINTAAYTAVDKAESDTEKAFDINVNGAKNLAETCRDYNVTLLHVSTDFVFDGNRNIPYTEEDTTNPQSIYGQTKLDGEQAIKQALRHYFIIRTSWLYSGFGNNFMKTMLRLAKERTSISVVDDQIGTPTHAVDLAEALIKIILSGKNAYGIYHFSNEGIASWHDFAKKIFEINHVAIDLQPIPSSQFPTPATRPKYSVLDKTKIKTVFGIEIKKWEDALIQ